MESLILYQTTSRNMIDLSVITATRQRPEFLVHCIGMLQSQSLGGLTYEHLIVSDGPDDHARYIADRAGARYLFTPEPVAQWGAGCRDLGVQHAQGKYICFWDDDNRYLPHALVALYAAVQNADIGVVRCRHRFRKKPGTVIIPRNWNGTFRAGDVDTMCLCVTSTLARKELWTSETPRICNDYDWLIKLSRHRPVVNFLPLIIGDHL